MLPATLSDCSRPLPNLITIYWRDIPAQVKAGAGRSKASVQLPERFQVAIDQAATRAEKTETDDYLGEWREERKVCDNDLEAAVERETARLVEVFTQTILEGYVRNKGWAP